MSSLSPKIICGAGAGFLLGVVEAEAGIFAGTRSAATAAIRESKRKDLAYFFSGDYLSACDLSTALARLIPAVVRGDVKPKTARTVAYLVQTLMQAIHISQHEYINAFGTDGWRKSVRNSVNGNYDYRFPPDPEQSESLQPQPHPTAVAHPFRGEAFPSAPQQTQAQQPASTPLYLTPEFIPPRASRGPGRETGEKSSLPPTPLESTLTKNRGEGVQLLLLTRKHLEVRRLAAAFLSSPPPVHHHVVTICPARGVPDSPPAQILQSLRMLRGQRMVRQENATVIHHMGDAAHGQRLLKKVVIDQHVGRYHQVESLSFGNVHGLRHHIHVESTHLRSVSRPDRHRTRRHVDYSVRNGQGLHWRAQHLS